MQYGLMYQILFLYVLNVVQYCISTLSDKYEPTAASLFIPCDLCMFGTLFDTINS